MKDNLIILMFWVGDENDLFFRQALYSFSNTTSMLKSTTQPAKETQRVSKLIANLVSTLSSTLCTMNQDHMRWYNF